MESQNYQYAMPRQFYAHSDGLKLLRDPSKVYKENFLLDVYMGCYKAMQMELRTANGNLVLREFMEHSKAHYLVNKTIYKLPTTHKDVQLDQLIKTYGLFVIKVPEVRTEGESEELENPSLERKIRDRFGNVIDTLNNHLFEGYLYVGRFKPSELLIDGKNDSLVFSKLVKQKCNDLERTLLTTFKFPPIFKNPKATVSLSPTRDLSISIPCTSGSNENYVIDHVTRKLKERDGLSNMNQNWAYYSNEEVYKMTLLYAFAHDNEQ